MADLLLDNIKLLILAAFVGSVIVLSRFNPKGAMRPANSGGRRTPESNNPCR